ncbi:Segmentation protein cap'n'collar [Halotydeus destructor]|nr:Segmentation protein cap'n'collar [Halotydeus destructor]
MVNKKNLLCDSLLYIALVASLSRLDNGRHESELDDYSSRSSVDHFGPTSVVNVYLHRFPRVIRSTDYLLDQYPSAKSNVVLEETLRLYLGDKMADRVTTWRTIQLGVPSPPAASQADSAANETVNASPARPTLSSSDHLSDCLDSEENGSASRYGVSDFEPKDRPVLISGVSRDDSLIGDFDESIFENVPVESDLSDSDRSDNDVSQDGSSAWPTQGRVAASYQESDAEDMHEDGQQEDALESSLRHSSHDPLLSASLFASDDGPSSVNYDEDDDVNNLWSLNAPNSAQLGHHQQSTIDSMGQFATESTWSPAYTNQGQAQPDDTLIVYDQFYSNPSTYQNDMMSYSDATGHNVGSAVASSMATLASTGGPGEPHADMTSTVYGNQYGDYMYLNANGTSCNSTANCAYTDAPSVVGASEYILSELLSEEDMQLVNQQQHHHLSHHGYGRQPLVDHHRGGNGNVYRSTEDRIDTSSDSAVSSMSGVERISTASEADWIDSCSESGSQNGDQGYQGRGADYQQSMTSSQYYNGNNHHSVEYIETTGSSQKKYKLFGRKPGTVASSTPATEEQSRMQEEEASSLLAGHNFYPANNGSLYEPVMNETYGSYYTNMSSEADYSTAYATSSPTVISQVSPYQHVVHNHTYSDTVASVAFASVIQQNAQQTTAPGVISTSDPSSSLSSSLASHMLSVKSQPRDKKPRTLSMGRYEEESRDEEDFGGSQYDDDDEESQATRDEKRARALNIPIATAEIINLPIDEFNERLAKYDLTEAQLSLIRDIRRRGKNKVAAQNCRKRKMDQIVGLQTEVDHMYQTKENLVAEQSELFRLRHLALERYNGLYAVCQ